MNYGKFFRLNKNLSRIEEGFAVYDYIDLPAYFTSSLDNQMSPKYPVSMTVMADSVIFKLHYSAYKIEESHDVLPNQADSKYPKYLYGINDKTQDSDSSLKSGDITKIVHMEETILELPYTDTVGRNLSDSLRDIYNTNFPLILNASDESGAKKKDSSGGRFLHNLIRKRYLEENVEEERDIHSHFYHSLRRISDGTPSYSTLWLMGLVVGEKDNVRYVRTDKKGNIVGFLRKLLLDFMFDLKHSDIFQNSSQFQKMYSGLMSDFYFSALMHKCEYYYYRKLTSLAIREINSSNEDEAEDRTRAIKVLYANELVKAEDLWVQDIMSPHAEKEFEHRYPREHKVLREFFEFHNFEKWPSWFAEPEEEMRRVCFTMKDNTGEKHICNADTLIRFLELDRNSEDQMERNMIDLRNDNKEQISRWFLKHYAFSDVLHLHLFKHANLLFLLFLILPIMISWFTRESLSFVYLWSFPIMLVLSIIASLAFCIRYYNKCESCGLNTFCRGTLNHVNSVIPESAIVKTRKDIVRRKIWKTVGLALFSFVFVWIGQSSYINEAINHFHTEQHFLTYLIIVVTISFIIFVFARRLYISVLHLFLPRLVASITLAWFTLSMGFDLYVSYFDSIPSLSYIIVICFIVLFFVVYSINLVIPHSPTLRKFLRGGELMVISYIISLFVGFVIINFLGEKYLERGGYISDYYTQHVVVKDGKKEWVDTFDVDSRKQQLADEEKERIQQLSKSLNDSSWLSYGKVIVEKLDIIENPKDSSDVRKVRGLKDVSKDNHKIAAYVDFWGIHIFVLRDFLIMFAFIAMFTGIFIQLIIFGDNKQMTEL